MAHTKRLRKNITSSLQSAKESMDKNSLVLLDNLAGFFEVLFDKKKDKNMSLLSKCVDTLRHLSWVYTDYLYDVQEILVPLQSKATKKRLFNEISTNIRSVFIKYKLQVFSILDLHDSDIYIDNIYVPIIDVLHPRPPPPEYGDAQSSSGYSTDDSARIKTRRYIESDDEKEQRERERSTIS